MLRVLRFRQLTSLFVLAFSLTWSFVLLSRASLIFGFLGLFGPAVAALLVATAEGGEHKARELLLKVVDWRAHPVAPGPFRPDHPSEPRQLSFRFPVP